MMVKKSYNFTFGSFVNIIVSRLLVIAQCCVFQIWSVMSTIINLLSAIIMSTNLLSGYLSTAPVGSASQPITKPIVQVASLTVPVAQLSQQIQHLSSTAPQLNKNVLKLALVAYNKESTVGHLKKPVLTVIDYSLPSSKQRMWIFDLKNEKLLYNTYVAHGRNSGAATPTHFSNKNMSKETSLGAYITRDSYIGSKGLSLNLQGMEKGFNDNAYSRRVVIHGAWYVEPDFIKKTGQAGRSWGCPSIAKTLAKPVINTIKGGSLVYAYYPDKYYLSHSGYILA